MLTLELRQDHVPLEYHLFDSEAHGISICTQEAGTPDQVCWAWLPLCKTWLKRRFQYMP